MFLRMWQALVVTELAPEHHSNEKSQRSFTTHRFTDTFFFRSSLCREKKIKNLFQNKNEHKSSFYLLVFGTISLTFRQVATSQFSCHNRQEWQDRFNMLSYSSVKIFLFNFILSLSLLSGAPNRGQ